jgi:hypothetical protein
MSIPDDGIRELARKTAKSIVDHGSIPMATLKESIILQDKVNELLSKEIEFPEQVPFPEIPEVDLTPIEEKLDELITESKKKDLLEYDLQIDEKTRKKLKGDKGDTGPMGPSGSDGLNGIDGEMGPIGPSGKDGSPDTAEQVRDKLSSLKGEERLDAKHIKNLPQGRVGGGFGIKEIIAGSGVTVDNSNLSYPVVSASGGSGSGDVVGPASSTDSAIALFDMTTGKLIKNSGITIADGVTGTLSGDNTGDQFMYGTIAVDGQSDLDPTGTGDTLTFVAGTNITLATNAGTNELTINSTAVNTDSFGIVVDGAGTAITTGSKGSKYIPWDCTITGWDIRSDVSGSCVFDVKRSGISLAGSEKPTLSGASSNQDLALSTWTTSLSAGDVVEFVVDSASTVTRATVTILVSKI